jgi:hypothetical protein
MGRRPFVQVGAGAPRVAAGVADSVPPRRARWSAAAPRSREFISASGKRFAGAAAAVASRRDPAWHIACLQRVQSTVAGHDARHASRGETPMTSWIATSKRLPQEGDALLFVIEHRNIVLCGIYSACMFKSRWSCYSPADISEWKLLDVGAVGPVCAPGALLTGHEEHKARAA